MERERVTRQKRLRYSFRRFWRRLTWVPLYDLATFLIGVAPILLGFGIPGYGLLTLFEQLIVALIEKSLECGDWEALLELFVHGLDQREKEGNDESNWENRSHESGNAC